MVFKSLRVVSAWFAILVCVSVSMAQDRVKYKELPNFHCINAGICRGGQPKENGLERLVSMGIKTVINLRDDDKREEAEEREVQALGMRYFNVPLNDLFGRPSDEQMNHLLAIVNAPENQPVFIHCRRGSDRTGTLIAVYRIKHDGWTGEQAKSEAKRYGMGFWVIGMKDYINDYYRRHLMNKAEASN
jgi:protein tyrosine/serine phosphatase